MTPELESALCELVAAARVTVKQPAISDRNLNRLEAAVDAYDALQAGHRAAWEGMAERVGANTWSDPEQLDAATAAAEPLPLWCTACRDYVTAGRCSCPPLPAPALPGVPLGKITKTVSPLPPDEATASGDFGSFPIASGTCPGCHERLRLYGRLAFCACPTCPCFAPPLGRSPE